MVDQSPPEQGYQYDWQNPNLAKFDFGRVFNRTFAILKRCWLSLCLVSFFLIGLPITLASFAPVLIGFEGLTEDIDDLDTLIETYLGAIIFGAVAATVLFVALSSWLQPFLIRTCYNALADTRETASVTLKQTAKFILPTFGFALIYMFLGVLGLLAFIIPGLLVFLGWMVAYHVIAVEGLSVTESISRAWELSRGSKRWLLLLAIVFGILGSIIGTVFSIPLYFMGDPQMVMLEGASNAYWITNALVSGVSQAIATALAAAWTTSAYVELRKIKEGFDPETRMDVFD